MQGSLRDRGTDSGRKMDTEKKAVWRQRAEIEVMWPEVKEAKEGIEYFLPHSLCRVCSSDNLWFQSSEGINFC
jgi:hypothetical protein